MSSLDDFLRIARTQIGVREGRDPNGNWNNRVKYNDWYVKATGQAWYKEAAWCNIFVSWVANQAGIPTSIIPRAAYTPASYNWFKARGRAVSRPQAGDIMYVYYAYQKSIGHIGIVERVEGNYVITIEGNTNNNGSAQGNGVYRLRRPISGNLYFVRPAYSSVPVAKIGKRPDAVNGIAMAKTVSVAHLKEARFQDPPKDGEPRGKYANEVLLLETALCKTEWMRPEHVDGHYGTATVGDGSLGYGGVTGFQRKHSGAKKPDGWMGQQELKLLFKLARMQVTVKA